MADTLDRTRFHEMLRRAGDAALDELGNVSPEVMDKFVEQGNDSIALSVLKGTIRGLVRSIQKRGERTDLPPEPPKEHPDGFI
ncbi:MAG: hypothetical protein Q8P82_02475 [bacterium]|nr:hypothetical protein [bacterium]